MFRNGATGEVLQRNPALPLPRKISDGVSLLVAEFTPHDGERLHTPTRHLEHVRRNQFSIAPGSSIPASAKSVRTSASRSFRS